MSEKDIVEEARELVKLHEANGCECRVCTLLRALANEVEGLRKQQKAHTEMVDDYYGSR